MRLTIEDLIDIFSRHAVKSEENQKRLRREFWENNPGEVYPENLSDEFNLPMSLAVMCIEIKELKEMVRALTIKQTI